MRYCSPERRTLPLSKLSTLRLRPTDLGSKAAGPDVGSGAGWDKSRPTITLSPRNRANSAVSSSVRPLATYCLSGSGEETPKSSKGKTDTERGGAGENIDRMDSIAGRIREPRGEARVSAATKTTVAAPAAAYSHRLLVIPGLMAGGDATLSIAERVGSLIALG